ncbi:MAG: hypothetical protein ACPHCZ_07300, partial [Candidatus Poseidoniaceae archaeon]
DDDGNDADADDDGFYQAVWDRGIMSQGLRQPTLYDVDNDNDAIPDGEDPDDDNDGRLDVDQELLPGCFWGEEQSTWDNDNDGIVNWADDDWDGDGLTNAVELLESITAPFDHDNDGVRDDIDEDDDEDGTTMTSATEKRSPTLVTHPQGLTPSTMTTTTTPAPTLTLTTPKIQNSLLTGTTTTTAFWMLTIRLRPTSHSTCLTTSGS